MDVNALSSTMTQSQAATASSKSSLSRDDFMNILISEMTNQDPMEPMDNQKFLSQLVQLESFEATSKLSDAIENLTRFEQLSSASSLIGHTVVGLVNGEALVEGAVEKVLVNNNVVSVVVDGNEIPMTAVKEVRS